MSAREILSDGRVAQKRRTRRALLDAGVRLLERGEELTLETVAAEADVSRATAYRYFPRIESLVSVLTLAHLVADPDTILDGVPAGDATEGALRTQRYFYELAVENETAFRRLLQANLDVQLHEPRDGDPVSVRGTYRLRTLEEALAPLEDTVPAETLDRLRTALIALTGIEALLVVKDVLGLDPEEGRRSLEWATRSLVEAALRETRNG